MLYALWVTEQKYVKHATISDMLHGHELRDIPDDASIIEADSLTTAEIIFDMLRDYD